MKEAQLRSRTPNLLTRSCFEPRIIWCTKKPPALPAFSCMHGLIVVEVVEVRFNQCKDAYDQPVKKAIEFASLTLSSLITPLVAIPYRNAMA
jgi:hypothetical protein